MDPSKGCHRKLRRGKFFDQIQFWAQIPTNIFPRNSEIRLALGNLIQSQFWSIKSVIILRYLSLSCTMYSLNIRFERDPLGNNFTWKGSFWQDWEDTSRGRKTNDFHQRRHQIKIFSAKTGARHWSKETFRKQIIVGENSRNQEESPGNLDNFFCGCLSCAAGSKYRKEYETEESDLILCFGKAAQDYRHVFLDGTVGTSQSRY